MKSKGTEEIYTIALIFTFILGAGSFIVLYSDTIFKNENPAVQKINNFLGLSDNLTRSILSGGNFTGSMNLVSVINESNTKGFIVENAGTLPLTGFMLSVDNVDYEPYASPSLLLPASKGAIITNKTVWDAAVGAKSISIITKQRATIKIYLKNNKFNG